MSGGTSLVVAGRDEKKQGPAGESKQDEEVDACFAQDRVNPANQSTQVRGRKTINTVSRAVLCLTT